jgi:NAD(P)-dependent dehydrogenase (short-subunit alcohol dehydrogenase family)
MLAEARGIDCSERTVIVTGAGTHLGRGIALRLLRDGFRCVLAGPDRSLLKRTVKLSGEDSSRAVVVECDIRIAEDRGRLIAAAVEQPGKLFGLVNNAAVFRLVPLFEENPVHWRETLETNVEAAFFLSQLAIEVMRSQRQGRIVNIASMHGMVAVSSYGRGASLPETSDGDRGPVRCSAYATSKGALLQLTRELALAAGRWDITVNAVSPGAIPPRNQSPDEVPVYPPYSWKPKLAGDDLKNILEAFALQVPLKRLGTVEDIAGPVRFLLSDDAAYITGANLVVDGGFTAW